MTDVGLDGDIDGPGGTQIIQAAPNVVAQEVNTQISTAKRFPRQPIARIIAEATELLTRNAKIAEECVYTLSRKNKDGGQVAIVGPSVRFAEVMAYCYGNLRIQSEFVRIDSSRADRVCVVAMAGIMDLERNTGLSTQSTRSVMTSKRNGPGYMFSADMIAVTINAAQSIAFRNAVLKLIPKAVWSQVYDAVTATIEGDTKTLPDRRRTMFARFKEVGVTPAQILKVLGVEREDQIRLADMPKLAGMFSAIRDGDDPEEVLGRNAVPDDKPAINNPLADHGPPSQGGMKAAMDMMKDGTAEQTVTAAKGQAESTQTLGEAKTAQDASDDHGPHGEDGEASGEEPRDIVVTGPDPSQIKKATATTLDEMLDKIKEFSTNGSMINWWKSIRAIREEMDSDAIKVLSDAYALRSKEILESKGGKASS